MASALSRRERMIPKTQIHACDLRLYQPETRSMELLNQISSRLRCSGRSLQSRRSDTSNSSVFFNLSESGFVEAEPSSLMLFLSAACRIASARVVEGI